MSLPAAAEGWEYFPAECESVLTFFIENITIKLSISTQQENIFIYKSS